jgi:PTH1 family peptidyl-tRNA hydrolase
MRLIVGLGNPGPEYEFTPHNLGFLAVDVVAGRAGIRVTRPEAKSYVGLGTVAGNEVVLAKPQTMMNLSGAAVRMLLERYECEAAEMVVLSDEAMLPWGMLRIRERGSAGGHNGLKSVIASIATNEFIRVRMGVKPEYPLGDMADYVLDTMRKPERAVAAHKAMTRFNRRVESEEDGAE